MRIKWIELFITMIGLLLAPGLRAENTASTADAQKHFESLISRAEFEALASELAPKVNLFREIWKSDPSAEFFGGTSRDYLYWLKGKLTTVRTQAEAQSMIAALRAQSVIDVREFILFESDIDVLTESSVNVQSQRFGIKKIDAISKERLDPSTQAGSDEIKQGFIPIEKIALGLKGIHKLAHFGDGFAEIYKGQPTVHFSSKEDFSSTRFAKLKLNHQVLLTLRYIRLLAMDYHRKYGAKNYPLKADLIQSIDKSSAAQTLQVIREAIQGNEISELLKNEKFKTWMNGTIQKAFRSYTNPTVAKMLMSYFGADVLISMHPSLEPIHQYLFHEPRDKKMIAQARAKYGFNKQSLTPLAKYFPDGRLYHGTRNEVAFRSILFQGVYPSASGMGGAGLYGVGLESVSFAEKWAGTPDRVVSFALSPKAVLVDVTQGRGKEIFDSYRGAKSDFEIYDSFARELGIDILRYEYSETTAFVVKNGEILAAPNGLTRKLMTIPEFIDWIRKKPTLTLAELIMAVNDNGLSEVETDLLRKEKIVQATLKTIEKMDIDQLLDSNPRLAGLINQDRSISIFPEIKKTYANLVAKYVAGLQKLTPEEAVSHLVKISSKYSENDFRIKFLREDLMEDAKRITAKLAQEKLTASMKPKEILEKVYDLLESTGHRSNTDYINFAMQNAVEPFAQAAAKSLVANEIKSHPTPIGLIAQAAAIYQDKLAANYYIMKLIGEEYASHVSKAASELLPKFKTMSRAQMLNRHDPLAIIMWASYDQLAFPENLRKQFRQEFFSAIPELFKKFSNAQLEDLLLEAHHLHSDTAWRGAFYEISRRKKNPSLQMLERWIIGYHSYSRNKFDVNIFDWIANFPVDFTLDTWKKMALQETSNLAITHLVQMWKIHGFDEKRDAAFLREFAQRQPKYLLLAFSQSTTSHQKTNLFPERWTVLDSLFKHLLSSKFTKKELLEMGEFPLYPWLNRVAEFTPEKVPVETLIRIYDSAPPLKALMHNDWRGGEDLKIALMKFPQLIHHSRGAQIIEDCVGLAVTKGEELDKQLKSMLTTHWKDHPRTQVWLQALELERRDFHNPNGPLKRTLFLQSKPMPKESKTLKWRGKSMKCGSLFAS